MQLLRLSVLRALTFGLGSNMLVFLSFYNRYRQLKKYPSLFEWKSIIFDNKISCCTIPGPWSIIHTTYIALHT